MHLSSASYTFVHFFISDIDGQREVIKVGGCLHENTCFA